MVNNAENTNSYELTPPKTKRFGLKLSIAIAITIIAIWLIPYLFSNYLFNTTIKRTFSELTNQHYSLEFKNLKINIFTREIIFFDAQIINSTKTGTLNRTKLSLFSDTLRFHNIDIQALRKYHCLKFENIRINKLKLEVEEQKSKTEKKSLNLPLSNYLEKLEVLNVSVAKAEINYKQAADSIYIPNLFLELQELSIDSLKNTVKNNRFHFADINLVLKDQQFLSPNKSHLISWKQLNLSSKEKYFGLKNFNIIPSKKEINNTKFTVEIPEFKMEGFEFDSLLMNNQLLTKKFILQINQSNIDANKPKLKQANSSFKQQLNHFFTETFNRIAIDSARIEIGRTRVNLSNIEQLNFSRGSSLLIDNFEFNPKNKTKFSLSEGSLSLNKLSFINVLNKQEIQFDKGNLDFGKQSLNIFALAFVSDSNAKTTLNLDKILVDNIDWLQLINEDKLLATNLYLKGANYIQQYSSAPELSFNDLTKIDSLIFPFFQLLKINTIHFKDWNYKIASKGISAKQIDMELKNFQVPLDATLAFKAFSNFNAKIHQLSWVSQDQRHHYLATDIESLSQTKIINISSIQSFPRWKTLNNETLQEKASFKLFGENIIIETTNPFYQINLNDTLRLQHLSIDSLNLKQFGKIAAKEKKQIGLVPIHIASFELRQGDFAAFNDSSILSRLAQVNGIHLQGDSVEIYRGSQFSVNYKHLIAITKNGFYKNEGQGLSFNFQKFDYDSETETMGMHQLKAELSSEKNKKSTVHQLNSRLVEIHGFDHNLFLQRNLISAEEFKLNSPRLISKSQSDNKQKTNLRNLFSAENLQQLPYLEFNRFIILDFTWLATYSVKGITNITSFEKANFEALDFRLSHWSFTNPERILFSKNIDFHIENFKQRLRNGNYLLTLTNIDFSSTQKQINFNNIQFYTLQKAGQNNYNFEIDRVSFNEINFADFQHDYSLSIENIIVNRPKTNLRLFGFDESSRVKNLNSLELYKSIEPYFSQVKFNQIDIRNMNLRLEIPKGNSTNTYNLGNLDLKMYNFELDSTSKAFQNNRFFYSRNTLVHLRNYSAQIKDDLYRVNFNDLRLSTLNGLIEIDSFQLKPQYNYDDFALRVPYQTDRFDIDINHIKLSGIDFQDALFRQKYTAQKAEISHLKGEVYRDGLYPRQPNYHPKNPIQRLLALPHFIQVDSLQLIDAYFAYKEKGKHTQNPGHIFFDQINAQILNVSNNPDFIKYGGNTVLYAQTFLMGKSKLKLDVSFPLIKQGKVFKLNANLDQIEMDDLEPIIRPLALIQARSGTIKSIDLSVEANDDYAFGNMLMLYNNMKVEVLNKSMKKGFWGTLMANALIKTENPSYIIPRKGPIYFERKKERSLFNYWAEISILGMKTSMGLADRRTAKKVKELQKK